MARIRLQSAEMTGKTAESRRRITAKPAAFEAVERKPATGVGAPSYTSGAQKWNGNNETLKASPASTRKVTPTASKSNFWK